ncbi:MAG: hypothetical protein AB7G47_19805 [Mycolicibacterium sp.]|uniref:hypothetical protein n=1 Tax=Mycolicibacterium sp. TaxID=2320850 RepID=UPI003D0FB6FE
MTAATGMPGTYLPAPVSQLAEADYRRRCSRYGTWWRPGTTITKTTAHQDICPDRTPLSEVPTR